MGRRLKVFGTGIETILTRYSKMHLLQFFPSPFVTWNDPLRSSKLMQYPKGWLSLCLASAQLLFSLFLEKKSPDRSRAEARRSASQIVKLRKKSVGRIKRAEVRPSVARASQKKASFINIPYPSKSISLFTTISKIVSPTFPFALILSPLAVTNVIFTLKISRYTLLQILFLVIFLNYFNTR